MEILFNYKGKIDSIFDGDEMVKPRIFKKFKKQFPFLETFLEQYDKSCLTATEKGIIGYI